jgi:hypothetical protein
MLPSQMRCSTDLQSVPRARGGIYRPTRPSRVEWGDLVIPPFSEGASRVPSLILPSFFPSPVPGPAVREISSSPRLGFRIAWAWDSPAIAPGAVQNCSVFVDFGVDWWLERIGRVPVSGS